MGGTTYYRFQMWREFLKSQSSQNHNVFHSKSTLKSMENLPLFVSLLPIILSADLKDFTQYNLCYVLCILLYRLTFDVIKKEIKNFVGFDNVDISTAAIQVHTTYNLLLDTKSQSMIQVGSWFVCLAIRNLNNLVKKYKHQNQMSICCTIQFVYKQ